MRRCRIVHDRAVARRPAAGLPATTDAPHDRDRCRLPLARSSSRRAHHVAPVTTLCTAVPMLGSERPRSAGASPPQASW